MSKTKPDSQQATAKLRVNIDTCLSKSLPPPPKKLPTSSPLYLVTNLTPIVRVITRVGTLIVVATIYLQLIQNRYMFRSFTVLHCSHQHCVQPVSSDVEVVGYL